MDLFVAFKIETWKQDQMTTVIAKGYTQVSALVNVRQQPKVLNNECVCILYHPKSGYAVCI